MQGAAADKDPEKVKRRETVKSDLERVLGVTLEPLPDATEDYVNPKTGTTYKLKNAAPGDNFPMEMLASANPEHFEKGWLYRYQALDYLVYYSDSQILLYAYKPLCKFFWGNFLKKISSGEWKILAGAGNNPWCVAIFAPSSEFAQCLRKTIPRQAAPAPEGEASESEGEDSEAEIPDEAEL